MTAKYVFHLENGAELPTQESIHHKWDPTNKTNNNLVILDRAFPFSWALEQLKLDSADLEDTTTVSTAVIWGQVHSFWLVIDDALIKKNKAHLGMKGKQKESK